MIKKFRFTYEAVMYCEESEFQTLDEAQKALDKAIGDVCYNRCFTKGGAHERVLVLPEI
jgi:hypothetical protein